MLQPRKLTRTPNTPLDRSTRKEKPGIGSAGHILSHSSLRSLLCSAVRTRQSFTTELYDVFTCEQDYRNVTEKRASSAEAKKQSSPVVFAAFDPSLIYSDVAFAAVLSVGDKKRQAVIRELRGTGKLLIDGVNHPIARGEDWLAAYGVVTG